MVSSAPRSRYARVASALASLVMLAGLLPAGVAAAPPSGSPTLLSPTEGQTVSSNPTFSWTSVGGAVKYRVQVSTGPAFSSFVYNVDTVNVKATPPADLPLGFLYWRVAATDGGSGVGTYTSGTFTKEWGAAPTITTPGLVDTFDFPTQPVLFRWQPLSGAKSYTLEIDDAPDFVGASSFTTNNTNFTLTEPPTINQTFFWRLRATSSTGGVVTDWSGTRQYTYTWLTVPTLLTPADAVGTPIRDITFSWSPVVGAKTYQIQISPNGDWDNNVIHDATIKSTKYTLSTNLDNGSYYWRVRAKDAKSTPNNGGWSNERQFTRNWPQHPDEVAPFYDGVTTPIVNVPTLQWTPVPLASHYEIWIGPDLLFSPGSFVTCLTNRTKVTPYHRSSGLGGEPGSCTLPYSPGTTFYWKVRAIDATGGIIGIFSETNPPDTWRYIYIGDLPTLVNPADNATVEVPTFIWDPVPNIERYVLTVKKQNGTTALSVTTYATSYTPPTALNAADGPFSWYVTTIDGNGEHSVIPSSADWFHFSLTTLSTALPPIAISSPDNGGSYARMPRMNWSAVTGATYYKVWYGVQGNPTYFATPLSGSAKLEYPGFTYSALPLPAGTYKFFIEAFDGSDGHVTSSDEWTFTITGPLTLGSGDYTAPVRCTLIATCTTLADTPTISWTSVPGAGAYEVTLANDANFTNEIKRYVTVFTTLTPRESYLDQQAGQAIYWFVRPCVDAGLSRCGPASNTNANANASAFRKNSAAVELASPPQDDPNTTADNIANQITFNWTDYLVTNLSLIPAVKQEAKSYRIEVSLAADFSTIFDTATVDQTTYTPFGKTYPEGPLYWRVQAIDGSGNTLTKSPARLVNKTSPKVAPTFPTNGSTQSGVPFFQWTPQAFAATYVVEVYKNGDTLFSPANRVLTATTKFSAWAPTTSLASGAYAWRVQRFDADNRAGPWSAARTFTLLAAAPSLTAPANAATVAANTLLFTWTAVSNAVQYRIEVAATCAFSPVTASQVTVMTAWAPITAYANGSYCWRVKALDAAGNTISTSSTRTFTIGTTPPPPVNGTTFTPVDPVRTLDSRFGVGLLGKFNANTARLLTVAGRFGIPNDAVAITGNLTVVGQTNAGYVSVTPTLNNNPSTSALNFPTGDTRANNITSPLSGGKLSIVYHAAAGAKTDILLDVTGYFLGNNSGATYKAVPPVRLLDTRFANGITGAIPSHTVKKFSITNRGGIPASATAVTGNFTVVGQTVKGYATLGPVVTDNPSTSTINFPSGDTRANGITVRLAGDGSLSLVWVGAAGKTAHFLFDVTGYYVQNLTGSKFYPLSPGRVLDTRTGTGLSGTFKTNVARTLPVEGHVGVPAAAIAVTGNLTVVGQTKAGYVSLTQTATNSPTTSTLNFPAADVRANGVTGPLSGAGGVGLVYKSPTAGASTNLILDITGYFGP